jgi:hypothetical protein
LGFALAAGGVGQHFFERYYGGQWRGRRAIAKIVGTALGSHLSERAGVHVSTRLSGFARELFKPTHARVVLDGTELPMTEHFALNAGSIDVSFRGLVRIFPNAKQEGVLHFHAGALAEDEILPALSSLILGSAIHGRHLIDSAGHEMKVTFLEEDGVEAILDGESLPRSKSLDVRRGPAIRVPVLAQGLRRRALALGSAVWRQQMPL